MLKSRQEIYTTGLVERSRPRKRYPCLSPLREMSSSNGTAFTAGNMGLGGLQGGIGIHS